MEYKYDPKTEMNLKDYFDKYKDQLPRLIMVTGGIYGKTKYDDFASDQVIRLHRYISQERVYAIQKSFEEKHYSIPINLPLKFRVNTGPNKYGPEEHLETILQKREPPFIVDVPSHQETPFEKLPDKSCTLFITEKYDQYYLQGHCITDNRINTANISTVIVITDIVVADIEGIEGKSEEEFQDHLRQFEEKIANSKQHLNDKDVDTRVRHIEVKKETPNTDEDSDTEYDYISPPILKPRLHPPATDDKPTTAKNRPFLPLPPIPLRRPISPPSGNKVLIPTKKDYENQKVQKCMVNPIRQHDDLYEVPVQDEHVVESDEKDDSTVSMKSIADITDILNKLGLEKYSEMFKADKIDGMTLQHFTVDALKSDYEMRHAEAVRLMNYAKTGHIPR